MFFNNGAILQLSFASTKEKAESLAVHAQTPLSHSEHAVMSLVLSTMVAAQF